MSLSVFKKLKYTLEGRPIIWTLFSVIFIKVNTQLTKDLIFKPL